jgi:putative PIG3 family NAD(P)H quinone oxidoreductase
MRASVITRFGDPDVLEIRDVDTPVPGPGQVLVRVRTSSLNRADLLQRMGRYPPPNDAPRDIPGMELAGEVAALGEGAARWREGDRVFGIVGGGAHAEYALAWADALAAVPAQLSWTDAGAIPEAFITAHDALFSQAALRAGESVPVHAVGSGVGLAACQVIVAAGATAYGTSRTPDKLVRAREWGMTDGAVTDAGLDALASAVAAWTGGRGFEVVLDLVGGPFVAASVEAAALKGRIMLVGAMGGAQASLDVRRVLGKRLTLRGTVLRARPLAEKAEVTRAFEHDVVPWIADGRARACIDSIFPLERIADAHRRMESNASFGKVVLTM